MTGEFCHGTTTPADEEAAWSMGETSPELEEVQERSTVQSAPPGCFAYRAGGGNTPQKDKKEGSLARGSLLLFRKRKITAK